MKRFLFLCIAFHTASLFSVRADWTTGQNADLVLGQTDFESGNPGTSATTLRTPHGVAVDPTTGNVFVSDTANHRVLRYPSLASLTDGAAAVGVLGQVDLNSAAVVIPPTVATMFCPRGIAIDANGTLWVADERNHRVLRFDNASANADGDGADADAVLGQTMFDTNASGTSGSAMNQPNGVEIDSGGTLWVADTINNRVLRFANAAGKANGSLAEGVLGQASVLTSASAPKSASSMFNPSGLAADGAGRLWVADNANNRVLRFDDAANKGNGAAAENVFGQNFFTTAGFFPLEKESSFNFPVELSVAPNGDLWVGDQFHNRVARFVNAAALGIRPDINTVLGQPDLTTAAANQSISRTNTTIGVFAVSNTVVLVVDSQNNRVLRFTAAPDPAPRINRAAQAVLRKKIRKTKKAIRRANKKNQNGKVRRLKNKLRRLQRQLRALS